MKSYGLLLLSFVFFGNMAIAADPICVRNYEATSRQSVCQSFPQSYAYVIPLDEKSGQVCARKYNSFYCETAPEFHWVQTADREQVCVLNNNQPPVANLCESTPQFYAYIKARH